LLLQQAAQALLNRYVTWQQSQWVGVACVLQLLLGDQLEYVDHPAQAQIAAVLDDDEVFLDTLACTSGEQAADLLQ